MPGESDEDMLSDQRLGSASELEVLQAEADYSFAVARRVDAERLETDARRRLAVFLGGEAAVMPVLTDSLRVEVVGDSVARPAAAFDATVRADLLALSSARDAAEAAEAIRRTASSEGM